MDFTQLNLDRFMYRNSEQVSSDPYGASLAAINSLNLYGASQSSQPSSSDSGSYGGASGDVLASGLAPASVVQSSLIQSSASDNRVEINPDDSFDAYENKVIVVRIDRNGIASTKPFASGPATVNGTFTYGGVAQPKFLGVGQVTATGTQAPGFFPSGWSVSHLATGRYQVTHNLGFIEYGVAITPVAATVRSFSVESFSLTDFIIRIADVTPTLTDTEFSFIVFTNPV